MMMMMLMMMMSNSVPSVGGWQQAVLVALRKGPNGDVQGKQRRSDT
jgi:hypothetical protein